MSITWYPSGGVMFFDEHRAAFDRRARNRMNGPAAQHDSAFGRGLREGYGRQQNQTTARHRMYSCYPISDRL
jgi:hypothetical protein